MTKTDRIVVFGAGETANLAYEYFTFDSPCEVVAFAVDAAFKKEDVFRGLPVVAAEDAVRLFPPTDFKAFVAVASGALNYQRARLYRRVKSMGYQLVSYVSSRAFVWRNVKIGENCFIMENNVLQPFTSVGDDVVMWSGNHVGHQSKIGDHCFLTSHVVISGFCEIGHNTFMGVNSCVADRVSVGSENFVAMGTAINKSTGDGEVYRGNPAMRMKISARTFCGVREEA